MHGTDEQKRRLLPRILDGTDRYCQGFSEPDAGSDLANVQTRGVVDGDELVITGQKVWTSWFWDATMCFALVRTEVTADRHDGISYVLVPLERDEEFRPGNGVELRPLRHLGGRLPLRRDLLRRDTCPAAQRDRRVGQRLAGVQDDAGQRAGWFGGHRPPAPTRPPWTD